MGQCSLDGLDLRIKWPDRLILVVLERDDLVEVRVGHLSVRHRAPVDVDAGELAVLEMSFPELIAGVGRVHRNAIVAAGHRDVLQG
jgi:hypothetical protein